MSPVRYRQLGQLWWEAGPPQARFCNGPAMATTTLRKTYLRKDKMPRGRVWGKSVRENPVVLIFAFISQHSNLLYWQHINFPQSWVGFSYDNNWSVISLLLSWPTSFFISFSPLSCWGGQSEHIWLLQSTVSPLYGGYSSTRKVKP